MDSTKPSNPKDQAAVDRAPLGLVPVVAIVEEALAFAEGLLKYGAHNYTIVGVRSSVYVFACARHLFKWWLGQEKDPQTGVHHLGAARASLGVLLDAQYRQKLTDDRPPSLDPAVLDAVFARAELVLRSLSDLYGSRAPRHYTIADTEKSAPVSPITCAIPDCDKPEHKPASVFKRYCDDCENAEPSTRYRSNLQCTVCDHCYKGYENR